MKGSIKIWERANERGTSPTNIATIYLSMEMGDTVTVHFPGRFSVHGELARVSSERWTVITSDYLTFGPEEVQEMENGDIYLHGSLRGV